ncbi:MAG: HigA family addiction module antitoxin [Burkholderiales bacterium]
MIKLKRKPTHPGEILREDVLPELRMSTAEFARQLRVSRQNVHKILQEKAAISPEMALRLGTLLGNGPGIWLRMQQNYDLWESERRVSDILKKIKLVKLAA